MMAGAPPSKSGGPSARKVYDLVERAVATRAEPLVQTGGFASALGTYMAANRRIGKALGGVTGRVLHLVNIPTARDIQRLHQHLTSVDDHIAALIGDLRTEDGLPESVLDLVDLAGLDDDLDDLDDSAIEVLEVSGAPAPVEKPVPPAKKSTPKKTAAEKAATKKAATEKAATKKPAATKAAAKKAATEVDGSDGAGSSGKGS